MSALDEYFGPRSAPRAQFSAKGTNYPRAPEHLRPLLDRFEELAAGQGVDVNKWMRKMWAQSARDYYEAIGPNVEIMEAAFSYMVNRNLMIKSLRSLIAVAMRLKATSRRNEYGETPAEEARRHKYAEWGEPCQK